MTGLIRLFFTAKEANPWLVLAFLVLAGLFEGLRVSTMLPVLSIVANDTNP